MALILSLCGFGILLGGVGVGVEGIDPVSYTHLIDKQLDRGVTFLEGRGGYTGAPKTVLMTAVKSRQISELKQLGDLGIHTYQLGEFQVDLLEIGRASCRERV